MWLRDSTAQVWPYIRLAAADPEIGQMVRGLIQRQMQYLLLDPYANAFNKTENGAGHQTDLTEMSGWVWERKYELDSLCYPVRLCRAYYDATGDKAIFDSRVKTAFETILNVIEREQHHDTESPYRFERQNSVPSDTLPFAGRGTRTNFTGMSWSGFRPSDDSCKFGYLIPANMFAVVILNDITEFARTIYQDEALAERASQLRAELDFGIQTYGIVQHPKYGPIYAYETDGYGNYNLMDDANVPSLLSIPYLGYRPASDPVYINTRAFVLSADNPYFTKGRYAQGVGSPHTPPGQVWPIGLTMQALTSTDRQERWPIIETLVNTTGGTGYMHESFDPDDPAQFSRQWFGWANSLFGELVIRWLEEEGKLP